MNVAVVASGIPNATSGGGALTVWSVLTHLLHRGHQVTAVCLLPSEHLDPAGRTADDRLADLEATGARAVPVHSSARTRRRRGWRGAAGAALAPRPEELLPTAVDREAVATAVRDAGADVAFVYHYDALAASDGILVPRLAAVGDPVHLPAYYRWRLLEPKRLDRRSARRALEVGAAWVHEPREMVRLLRRCAASGAFAAHHAAWLRRRGVRGCEYLRTPIPDAVGARWREERERRAAGVPRILHLGHLRGTATLQGLRLLLDEVLPAVEEELAGGYELRFVGGYDPPEELRPALDRPGVRLLGHLDPPDEAFLEADAFVVPIAIPLGVRVRILTAFSFGTCVVAHAANARGIPELRDGANAYVGGDGRALAAGVLQALRDPEARRRVEAGARATYERHFAQPLAAGRIERILQEIAA